jgi:hypothetical protein
MESDASAVNIPVIIAGAQYFGKSPSNHHKVRPDRAAPYNWSFVWSGVPLAWFFMSYLYRKCPAWWNKYCCKSPFPHQRDEAENTDILSIGLTIGAAVSGVVQFFCITFPGARLNWWGNTFYTSGCDGLGCPLQPLPEGGYFGPGVSLARFVFDLVLGTNDSAWRISVKPSLGARGK